MTQAALQAGGYQTTWISHAGTDLPHMLGQADADVILMDVDSPQRDTLEQIVSVTKMHAKPVVLFSHDGDTEKIRQAVKAGVSAYVVGNIASQRLEPILAAAVAQFDRFRSLQTELEKARKTLADRKMVDKAKGILMKERGLTEDEAYRSVRKMAMDENMRIGEAAKSIVAAAHVLIHNRKPRA